MDQEKLDLVDAAVIKAAGLFGGGVAGSGNTCGAVPGAVTVLSSVYSRGTLEEKVHAAMGEVGGRLVRKFEEPAAQHGGIRCQDIARVNWRDPLAVREFLTSPESRKKYRVPIVGKIAEAPGELIEVEVTHWRPGPGGGPPHGTASVRERLRVAWREAAPRRPRLSGARKPEPAQVLSTEMRMLP